MCQFRPRRRSRSCPAARSTSRVRKSKNPTAFVFCAGDAWAVTGDAVSSSVLSLRAVRPAKQPAFAAALAASSVCGATGAGDAAFISATVTAAMSSQESSFCAALNRSPSDEINITKAMQIIDLNPATSHLHHRCARTLRLRRISTTPESA